jgi:hypothetical protein
MIIQEFKGKLPLKKKKIKGKAMKKVKYCSFHDIKA